MKRFYPVFAAVALAVAAPLAAAPEMAPENVLPQRGDEITKFRTAGAWTIRQNLSRENCFASYKAESGAIIQFGFVADESAGYLGLFSPNVGTQAADQEVVFVANGNIYTGIATGVGMTDGYNGGYVLVNNPDFVRDVEKGRELVVFPETPDAYVVDMSGAANAVYEVRKCTAKLGK